MSQISRPKLLQTWARAMIDFQSPAVSNPAPVQKNKGRVGKFWKKAGGFVTLTYPHASWVSLGPELSIFPPTSGLLCEAQEFVKISQIDDSEVLPDYPKGGIIFSPGTASNLIE